MTAALHLAPIVAAGVGVQRPVDIYESTVINKEMSRCSGHTHDGSAWGRQMYPGSGAIGREIGVGIWSTAWWPFLKNMALGDEGSSNDAIVDKIDEHRKNRHSYKVLLHGLEACGSYVKDVGYRTPDGSWLVKSGLNSLPHGIENSLDNNNVIDAKTLYGDPALLFLREKDLLTCLRNAINIEQRLGNVQLHSGVRVDGLDNVNGDLGSLILRYEDSEDSSSLSPQYNLIIAADGLDSILRTQFAGHSNSTQDIQTSFEPSTQREATQVESREYIVFRGNAPKLESSEEDGSRSFQTWGENRSMRFAAVPYCHETEYLGANNYGENIGTSGQSFTSKRKDEEVWFATISDPAFADAPNAAERKQLLLQAFGQWHKPIKTLIETTPAEKIMYEYAIAHRHNTRPVFDVATIMEFDRWQNAIKGKEDTSESAWGEEKINGRGPILQFIGDSYMTVDPVLAQGFTMAMESGASLANSIEHSLISSSTCVYEPKFLRETLNHRYSCRERRLLQLLRSTELVQRMAQPQGTLASIFATWIVRPLIKLSPAILKKKVFDFLIRYSLGLAGMGDHGIELGSNKPLSNRLQRHL